MNKYLFSICMAGAMSLYPAGEYRPLYLSSRDNGLTWKKVYLSRDCCSFGAIPPLCPNCLPPMVYGMMCS